MIYISKCNCKNIEVQMYTAAYFWRKVLTFRSRKQCDVKIVMTLTCIFFWNKTRAIPALWLLSVILSTYVYAFSRLFNRLVWFASMFNIVCESFFVNLFVYLFNIVLLVYLKHCVLQNNCQMTEYIDIALSDLVFLSCRRVLTHCKHSMNLHTFLQLTFTIQRHTWLNKWLNVLFTVTQ